MNKTFCQDTGMRHDERLQRMLNGYEFRHFQNLLAFAAEGRDPTFIPARRMENLRLALRLTSAKLEEKLLKFEAPGLELIRRSEDGLLIDYLVDQEDDDEGSEGGATASGSRGRRKPLSMAPGAIRTRNMRTRQQQAESVNGNRESVTKSENVTQSVTPNQSNCDALASQNSVTNASHLSRMRDGNVQRTDPSLNLNSSQEEENTLNVPSSPNVTHSVTPSAGQSVTPRPASASPPPRFPVPKNGRARFLADQAVKIAQELQDIGSEDGHYLLLAVADEHGADDIIQEALRSTRRRMNNSKMPPLDRPGAYFQRAARKQFEHRQIFLPTKADLAAEESPNEVRRLIAESMAAPPAIVPLDDLYDGAAPPPPGSDPEDYTP